MRVFFLYLQDYCNYCIICKSPHAKVIQKSYSFVPYVCSTETIVGKGKAEKTVKPAAGREITRPQRQQQQHRRVWRRQL